MRFDLIHKNTMIIDGKKIAEDIKAELKAEIEALHLSPVLAVVMVGDDPVTERFVGVKKKFAEDIGVRIEEHRFSKDIESDILLQKVEDMAIDDDVDGIIIQLPLPAHIDREAVLGAIPAEKDVDVISHEGVLGFESGDALVPPPVLGAMVEILRRELVEIRDKKVVIIGRGLLVGIPAEHWFKRQGALVTVMEQKDSIDEAVADADILVLGAGSPGIITPGMVKEGVIILDAGTSEAAGKLQGDADYRCVEKAHLMTPVPGGIGPITVAILFKNLIDLIIKYGN